MSHSSSFSRQTVLLVSCATFLLAAASIPLCIAANPHGHAHTSIEEAAAESAVLSLAAPTSSQQPAAAAAAAAAQEESYQRVYEAFTKLMDNTAQNSLSSIRRLVSRLNTLVGQPEPAAATNTQTGTATEQSTKTTTTRRPQVQQQQQQPQRQQSSQSSSDDEKTEQILNRLDTINRDTDQHTLQKLNEDVSKLISTLNNSYLRNIRRVIERVNRVMGTQIGSSSSSSTTNSTTLSVLQQDTDRLVDQDGRLPGFPGFDELIVAMDRMQKSLAHFVRSSTRLITAG